MRDTKLNAPPGPNKPQPAWKCSNDHSAKSSKLLRLCASRSRGLHAIYRSSRWSRSAGVEGQDYDEAGPKKSERKSNPSRKKPPGRNSSPDNFDPSSDSDKGNSDSSSWSDSSGEKARSSTKTSSKAKVGSTLLTVRPFVNPNSLELNETAVKAGIKYKSPVTKRAQHIKRFMKSLRDKQLKAILVNQRFHDVDDLVYVLQQDEDLAQDGAYDMPPPKPRDFRADNVHPGRFKPKRPGRAYVVQSDAESDAEQEGHVRFDDEVEDIGTGIPEATTLPRSVLQGPSLEAAPKNPSSRPAVTDEDIRNAVFRVMEHSGWRPVKTGERPGWQSPRRENPDGNEFCSECHKFGHKPENCWKGIILLDTGASVSMISLDLARMLKLKRRMQDPIRVSGLGGVPTYISASARIKIALGPRIVYVMTVYVANLGEGLEVLLGMNFMYAAGVRLSLREGLNQLPDEETVVMCGNPTRDRPGLDLPVFPERSLCLPPGEHAIVKIRYGQSNPQREVVWA
ncbi:unnamed protein product [Phytophthora fragariaefolia]|uniref:Unnamed protein product n=1 Tax=Phytophthora fragariaefolia TaxID=1490495 RepID=A0A9W6XWD9_9STRA|nr:unnamed protein product [Phytophthora fragariaefolia]